MICEFKVKIHLISGLGAIISLVHNKLLDPQDVRVVTDPDVLTADPSDPSEYVKAKIQVGPKITTLADFTAGAGELMTSLRSASFQTR